MSNQHKILATIHPKEDWQYTIQVNVDKVKHTARKINETLKEMDNDARIERLNAFSEFIKALEKDSKTTQVSDKQDEVSKRYIELLLIFKDGIIHKTKGLMSKTNVAERIAVDALKNLHIAIELGKSHKTEYLTLIRHAIRDAIIASEIFEIDSSGIATWDAQISEKAGKEFAGYRQFLYGANIALKRLAMLESNDKTLKKAVREEIDLYYESGIHPDVATEIDLFSDLAKAVVHGKAPSSTTSYEEDTYVF